VNAQTIAKGGTQGMKRFLGLFVCAVTLFFCQYAYGAGSGAYRLEVPDAEAMGKGSAFVAQANNPSAIYYNPAGIIQLKGNNYFSVGTTVIQPFMEYKDNSGNETKRRKQQFVIPHTYFVSDFGLKKFAFGIGASSTFGLGTSWAEDSFSRYVSTDADLTSKDVMLVGAYALNDNLSFGAGLDYTALEVSKKKQLAQLGGADGYFKLSGKDNNVWGYRLSMLYKVNPRHRFGLTYRSQKKAEYKGKIYMNGLNDAGSNYEYFFGGTSYETKVSSKSTLPQSILAGYCYQPSDKWTFEGDVEWMDWRTTKEEKITYETEIEPARLFILNTGNPTPRDWRSVFSYAFGTEYKLNEKWRLRGGYFYHKSPIPQATFDTTLPDSDSHSITTGVGYTFNKNFKLDLAYAAMFYRDRVIDQKTGFLTGTNVDGRYSQFANLYLVTLNYKY
jgi:long-chain fatty acid transport protein